MMTRCAYVIGAMALFSLNGAIGQMTAGASLLGNEADSASQNLEQHAVAGKKPDPRAAPPGGNPLWGIPVDLLSATRERPLFSASRRPPAPPPPPMPVAEAPPPPPPAAPETPPFTLIGTAVGQPQDVALIIDQTTKSLVRLHIGEAASGWYLRKVDARAMTLEKDSRVVSVALPAPGELPAGTAALAVASGAARQF
ncbi:general secretion pathway protein GspN [Methylocapsa sp. D3K7]|uniref:general secretion pathway protein GspN n=1 Tax=Methylocapsa sp. D3K7 TaxID=3041435 RepID=UPI00244E7B43|nr:general secretion pathway protein GspN [Methylocapsa sp. D3K7]WGJ13408.1 general secretion pathway protein GspN [Methylocapsa sp. D3K7]